MKTLTVPVEIREAEGDGPRLHGTIIAEGRAARGGRAEVFAPGAVVWPERGIAIRAIHRGKAEAYAMPVRQPDGEIRVAVKATPALVSAYEGGRRQLSVEFFPLKEIRTVAGVREVQRALVDGAALVPVAEYPTRAELRSRRFRVWL